MVQDSNYAHGLVEVIAYHLYSYIRHGETVQLKSDISRED